MRHSLTIADLLTAPPHQPVRQKPQRVTTLAHGPAGRINGGMTDQTTGSADSAALLESLLLRVAQQRDRVAFRSLYQHFAPRLRSYMAKLGADSAQGEELVQEVMLTVWRRADSFDPAQAGVGTWIYTIARNRRIDALRSEKRPELDPDDPALVPAAPIAADDQLQAKGDLRRLHAAIADLPAEQADLLQLAYFEGKPHSEIASERGLPLGTVKSRLRLALGRLRTLLGDWT